MPFTATKFLYDKAVEEVAAKLRAESRAGENLLQFGAKQGVDSAYEFALQHHQRNPAPQMTNADALTMPASASRSPRIEKIMRETRERIASANKDINHQMKDNHRTALIQFFTISGVSSETSGRIVDVDILGVE